MQDKNKLGLACIISILITMIFSTWFIFNMLTFKGLFFTENLYQTGLIILCICFIITVVLLRRFSVEIRYEIDTQKEKEKNIHDIYLYNQLLDPPSTNN